MRLSHLLKKQQGVTLIETLVSMAVGILLLGAAASVGLGSLAANKDMLANSNAQNELQNTMNIISKELRRAGYSATEEPSQIADGFRNIWFSGGTGKDNHTCAVFRYDRTPSNPNPLLPPGNGIVATTDVRGIRLNSGKIELLTSTTDINAIAAGCAAAGTWEPITQTGFNFSSFTMSYSETMLMDGTRMINTVTVNLTGSAKNGNTQSLSQVIQLRNQPFKN